MKSNLDIEGGYLNQLISCVSSVHSIMHSFVPRLSGLENKECYKGYCLHVLYTSLAVLSSISKSKDRFIDHLKSSGGTSATEAMTTEPTWNVLREDFMKGSKLMDWDKIDHSESNCSDDD